MLFPPSLLFFWEKTSKTNTNKPEPDVACALQRRLPHCFAGISQAAVEINKAGLVKWGLVFRGEGKRGERRISFSKNHKNVMQFI